MPLATVRRLALPALFMATPIAVFAYTVPVQALGVEQCYKYKKGSTEYKRCLSYLNMAGTPVQRRNASDQMRQDRERRRCSWYPSASASNRLWVCNDYITHRERELGIRR
ncbi:hypothetical protein [Methylobacterium nodulans]|uniref:Uncharacterized protein n=1 Tax=Methylobacterium nodulans (strain LMG 21967 / CNCM I-2342 / ORS 2060) TaxID=460265 RepID=B8IA88_METNO|nr:hypothetical protein [Methylobacterium nodulans]ACL59151.1 hypothetical protein Mnod_4275 [Methylobacterium nodulans ORS 2060]